MATLLRSSQTLLLLSSVSLQLARGTANFIDLHPWGSNSMRVRIVPDGGELAEPILGALLPEPPWEVRHGPMETTIDVDGWSTTHGNLKIGVNTELGTIIASRISDGAVLLRQSATATFGKAEVPRARPGSRSAVIRFDGLQPDERIYGLGERRKGRVQHTSFDLNFADDSFYGTSHGSRSFIPWYCTTRGYGFVWNVPSLGHVSMTQDMIEWKSNATRNIDFWITTTPGNLGDSHSFYIDLLHQYADAVGHPRQLPHWATGFIQSKDRYRNQSQVLAVAREYVERGLPLSMIVVDWFHWIHMGDWEFDPNCFPDPLQMVEELRSLGVELMTTFWPYIGMPNPNGSLKTQRWPMFRDKRWVALNATTHEPENFWTGGSGWLDPAKNAVVDATNREAMQKVADLWFEGYGRYGIRAIWLDQSEPDHTDYISGGQYEFQQGMDAEILPAWVKYWTSGFARKFAQLGWGDDFFLLSRHAWAGTAANGAALWSGDISSSWDNLRVAVSVGQGVAMSGVPLWTTDIGGYSGGNESDPSFQELIVRWFQFGAFCPLFRLHGHRDVEWVPPPACGTTNGDNEVWNLAPQPDHYMAIREVMLLRESLREYVFELGTEAAARGTPIMRPMALEFPHDPVCEHTEAEAQFMLGSLWLTAPVTVQGAASWSAYLPALPADEQWLYWWNSTVMEGPRWVAIDTSKIGHFPLFRREARQLPAPPISSGDRPLPV